MKKDPSPLRSFYTRIVDMNEEMDPFVVRLI